MRIDSVRVAGFRSIENTSLDSCGKLNVLIGKNNSGKSNLLIGIKRFFDFFTAEGRVATITPDMRQPNDWYQKDTRSTISISVSLMLDDVEREDIRESIVAETPQVKNALASAELSNLITVDLRFTSAPASVGYVSKISFGGDQNHDGLILEISEESATEIAKNSASIDEYTEECQILDLILKDFEEEDWRRIKERGYLTGSPRMSRIAGMSGQATELIVRHSRAAGSYAEFRGNSRDRLQLLSGRIEEATSSLFSSPISTFSGSATSIPEYVTSLLHRIAGMRVHILSEQRKAIGPAEASRILKLKTSRGQGEVLTAIQSVVSGLLGVQIDAFSADDPLMERRAVPPSRRGEGIPAELDVDDFLVQLNGSGIREALRLILDREFERPDVLLVEEPEVHLHPALEIAIMQYLKEVSEDCQIFLTTHSTNFLDAGSLRNIYLIRRDRATSVRHMDLEEAEDSIPEELGLRLSSLFMFDRLAFVEGPSDEQILRIFASIAGISFGQAALGFVTTGGARNFTHYATTKTLEFLNKRNVRTLFLIDRDERDAADVDDLKKRVEGVSELVVLRRRELENYLLSPTALSRYINSKSGGAATPSPEDVESALDDACQELFQTAVERRVLKRACRPVIPKREKVLKRAGGEEFEAALKVQLDESVKELQGVIGDLGGMIDGATIEVQGEWDSRKLELIPGDEILDSMFRHYGLRFNKRKDAVEIASQMRLNEIPGEIREILDNLVR
ncbi:ATP-dependent nuclease [Streptomyces sp. NPDC102278]|uniref:ATP-dependent nuclease n=1 Tax=Streptomyces sp. NPDC102278 TaxID=3366152 RepID=UPI003824BD03